MDNIDQFIDLILKEKGLGDLDADVMAQLKQDLASRLTMLINRRLVEALPEDKLAELERLLSDQPQDQMKIQNYLSSNIPNLSEITINAMQEFKSLYLAN